MGRGCRFQRAGVPGWDGAGWVLPGWMAPGWMAPGCRARRHGLLLVLDVVHDLLEAHHAGTDLVEGIVEGLDLSGDLIGAGGLSRGLGGELLLQGVHVDGEAVDGVGGLLDEVFEDAHALVVGLLEAGYSVEELLDLGLELDHVLVDGEGGGGGHQGYEEGGGEADGLEHEVGSAFFRFWAVWGENLRG